MKAKLKEIVDKCRQAILLANTLQFRSQRDARKMTEITLALVASERIANELLEGLHVHAKVESQDGSDGARDSVGSPVAYEVGVGVCKPMCARFTCMACDAQRKIDGTW